MAAAFPDEEEMVLENNNFSLDPADGKHDLMVGEMLKNTNMN